MIATTALLLVRRLLLPSFFLLSGCVCERVPLTFSMYDHRTRWNLFLFKKVSFSRFLCEIFRSCAAITCIVLLKISQWDEVRQEKRGCNVLCTLALPFISIMITMCVTFDGYLNKKQRNLVEKSKTRLANFNLFRTPWNLIQKIRGFSLLNLYFS